MTIRTPRIDVIEAGTLTNGILGKTTGAVVPAGYVGEKIESSYSGVSVLTSGTTNLANIVLTPGVWSLSFGARAGGTTSAVEIVAGIATTSASTTGWSVGDTANSCPVSSTYNGGVNMAGIIRNISTTTTYYLTAQAVGAALSTGGRITAVRIA